MKKEWPENDPLSLRAVWLVVLLSRPSGGWRASLEAAFNIVRLHPPITWRTGARVVRIEDQ